VDSAALLPDDLLFELLRYAFEPWRPYDADMLSPPTQRSLDRIFAETGIRIPEIFSSMAFACPNYISWFAGLGEDSNRVNHFLEQLRAFRDEGLPSRYVIFNHGFDGDCDCWDTEAAYDNEPPIVYVQLNNNGIVNSVRPWATTFREYLDRHARHYAPRCSKKGPRRRAKRLLEGYPPVIWP